jgi:hypothetical protein
VIAAGDFNADGNLDLASGAGWQASIALGNGTGGFAAATTYDTGANLVLEIAAGDFNGDGRCDLAVAHCGTDTVAVLCNVAGTKPVTLTSAHGLQFDVAVGTVGSGQLIQGPSNAFDGDGRLLVADKAYAPSQPGYTTSDGGQTLSSTVGTAAGLSVSREVTVPNSGTVDFVRTVDIFTNSTSASITTTVTVVGNLGSDAGTEVFATSNGSIDRATQWIGTDDGVDGGGTPATIHYLHGGGGLKPVSACVSGDSIQWTYQLTVPAGQTVRLAYLTIVANTRAEARAAALALTASSGLAAQAAQYLTSDELASLVNFQTNRAPVLDNTGAMTLAAEYENYASSGSLVSAIIASAGGDRITDANLDAGEGIAVTAVDDSHGVWEYRNDAGGAWNRLGPVSDVSARLLSATAWIRFVPATDWTGIVDSGIAFRAWDQSVGMSGDLADATVGGGTTAFSTAAETAAVAVLRVNRAPTGADATRSTREDAAYTFSVGDFGFADPLDSPSHRLSAVKITSLPTAGVLTLKGATLAAGQEVALADLAAGNLVFAPAANAVGSPYAQFAFQVRDDGGTAGGGVNLDPNPETISILVTAVNDAPAGSNGSTTMVEDSTYTFALTDFGFTDSQDSPANSFCRVWIATLPTAGCLKLDGVAATESRWVAVTDIAAGKLLFVPEANGTGNPHARFTFQVQDDGGTANGGMDLDPTPNTFVVCVTNLNDAPTGTGATWSLAEDTPYVFAVADFGFADPYDNPPNKLRRVKVTTPATAGTLSLSGVPITAGQWVTAADIAAGKLVFTPAANANGAGYASFTFQVQDDGWTTGGGADLDPTPREMGLNVLPVNDPPVVAAITPDADPVEQGQDILLQATGVADPFDSAGRVVCVAFYRESNGTAGLQTGTDGDTLVALDEDSADGWSARASTADLPARTYTYYAQATDNEGAAGPAAATTSTVRITFSLDVDGNGRADALTDGILVLRYLFDAQGSWNYADALGSGATRTTREAIRAFLDGARGNVLDVDSNGSADALTDGILILRYLFDPEGSWNYADALGNIATRTTRAGLKSFLDERNPGRVEAAMYARAVDQLILAGVTGPD